VLPLAVRHATPFGREREPDHHPQRPARQDELQSQDRDALTPLQTSARPKNKRARKSLLLPEINARRRSLRTSVLPESRLF